MSEYEIAPVSQIYKKMRDMKIRIGKLKDENHVMEVNTRCNESEIIDLKAEIEKLQLYLNDTKE